MKKSESKQAKNTLYSVFIYFMIILGGTVRALNLQIFVLPNDFAPGGVTGLSAMLQFVTNLNSGIFLLIFNLPLILVGAFFLGKTFAIRTTVSSLTTSGLLLLFAFLEEKGFSFSKISYLETKDPLLAAFAGGVLSGLTLAILIKSGSSTGGSDIIASILHKKRPDMNLGSFIFIIDAAVVAVSVFVYNRGLDPALLAFIMIFVSTTICDTILAGAKSAQKFEIITKDPEKVSNEIMSKLSRGVTLLPAKGMYTQENSFLLICIVRKRQIPIMQKIIRDNPDTFCYVSSTSDVYGNGFSKGS